MGLLGHLARRLSEKRKCDEDQSWVEFEVVESKGEEGRYKQLSRNQESEPSGVRQKGTLGKKKVMGSARKGERKEKGW